MARKKTINPKTDSSKKKTKEVVKESVVQKPIQINNTVNCTINSSYTIDYPDIMNFTSAILLNGKQIEGEISNIAGKYKGVKMVKKNNKFIIYTGKHGLNSTEDITSGILTIQFMEI